MKYFKAMQSKFGFDDGEIAAADAEYCRDVYVKALNKLLLKHKSKIRVIKWNRSARLFIVPVSIRFFNSFNIEDVDSEFDLPDVHVRWDSQEPAYLSAVAEAMYLILISTC